MQSIGEVLNGRGLFVQYLNAGKKLQFWYLNNGYISTNFGWLHKDWIDQGFKMGAIAASPYDGV